MVFVVQRMTQSKFIFRIHLQFCFNLPLFIEADRW